MANQSQTPSPSSPTGEFFDMLASVLLRCWILGFVLLLVWFGVLIVAPDLVFGVHGPMFELSRHELLVIHYCGMGLVKLVVGLLFFFPWIAIRLVLKKRN